MKRPTDFLFWFCAVGCFLDVFLMLATRGLGPAFLEVGRLFAVGSIAFLVGAIANYLLSPKTPPKKG